MRVIDLSTWKRQAHFEFFYRMDYPQYNVCANVDVTHFLQETRRKGLSFYYSMLFAVTHAANRCEPFRYRIRADKQVVLHDRVHPSFTDMDADTTDELFKMVLSEVGVNSLSEYVALTKERSAAQRTYFDIPGIEGRDDLLYITCLPWISFTHLSHTIRLDRNDAVPRISWGKYFVQEGKTWLPFSVQAHHAFVDGIHVGQYLSELQLFLENWSGEEGD